MGVLCKVVDGILLLTFLTITVVATFLDSQCVFPKTMFPNVLVRFYKWYSIENQDYLLLELPHFFVALMKLELFYVLPLALINIYGMLTSKPWFNSTCLIFGSALIASTTAMVGDILGSQKPGSDKLALMYSPFIGFGVLALLRGLLAQQGKASSTIGNGPGLAKKRA
ncbi:hypothetical protein REPUB_Repub01dG0039300 [Reevesia pubescens]